MARPATVHVCSQCAHVEARWHGQCPGCGEWNTLVEERSRATAGGAAPAGARPVPLREVRAERTPRLHTQIGELDRVLGGGLVPGSLVLLGGSPGIGKSTLTNMALGHLAGSGRATLYVSGEESAAQIRLRAERLERGGVRAALDVPVLAETDLDAVCATLEAERPAACVIDSVQTLAAAELGGAAGSVGQVREVATRITAVAKRHGIAVLLVGHVTKEGVAGRPARARAPRRLRPAVRGRARAHLPHAARPQEPLRLDQRRRRLRDARRRAGRGARRQRALRREATRAPGSVVLASMEGSRPLLVEVQALVSPSELVPPRRVCTGYDRNRLALVLAVLGRHAGVGVGSADVFVNVVGGVRIDEPGADLAVALAVASAARGVVCGGEAAPVACFGEVGLTGELRSVAHPDRRLEEAAKFGLRQVVSPDSAPTLRAAVRAALGQVRAAA